jgi:hypothetical protein
MTIEEIVERVIALRWIEKTHGMKTGRSQQSILRALPDAELAEVSVLLKRREQELEEKEKV